MLRRRLVFVLALGVVGVFSTTCCAIASAADRPAASVVVAHWHEVAGDLADLGGQDSVGPATNQYLLLVTQQTGNPNAEPAYTLLNTLTGAKTPITTPPCFNFGTAALSARYFATECQAVSAPTATTTATTPPVVYLLNLSTGAWTAQQLNATVCASGCSLDGIGNTWMRIEVPPLGDHNLPGYALENIATGAIDQAHGPDNLDNVSGVSRPCTTVPRDGLDEDFLSSPAGPGDFTQLGDFLLSTGTYNTSTDTSSPAVLRACHAKTTQISIPHQDVAATSHMVVWQPSEFQGDASSPAASHAVYGRSVPGLRSFVIRQGKGPLAAVSNTTIYETVNDPAADTYSVWATTVPKSVLTPAK
jgi:hypothetical protein